ncbi:MAG: CvpA family protein [Candidatus Magasanikbacteria bacterium]
MSLFDIILLVLVGGFAMAGFWFGFVHTLGSLVGTLLGAFLASRYYEPMAEWLIRVTGWPENTSRVFMFIVAFFIINRLVGFLFWIVDKFLSIITRLPFIKSLNRLLGLALGLFEGVVTVGLILLFIERFPLSERIMSMVVASTVAPYVTSVAEILWFLMPDAVRMLESTINYIH